LQAKNEKCVDLLIWNKTIDLDAGFETKDADFKTKRENLFACIQYFSMCLAAAGKVLREVLLGNNRQITDYLKNGRLIGFAADYLPINRLIPSYFYDKNFRAFI
jgi:hypothetical protein